MKNRQLSIAMVVTLLLAGCGGAKSDAGDNKPSAGSKGTVKLAINPWVGYEANADVLAYLLEHQLGYTVEKKNLKEEISWQGFETGEVDAIVENWGHDDLKKTYIEEKKVAVEAGPTGNTGVIGWYVPQWLADEHPDITDWNNLNKYADLFKTSESGGKGQLLDGDPSYVTNDEALVGNLKLNYKVVYSGSEAALIKAAQQATAQKKPLLFYFYEPQWLFAKEKYARVKLPAYSAGCDADPKKVACDYPDYKLDKIVSKKFADTGGAAYGLIKNFTWTNDDQNLVSDYLTNQGMSADQAAEKWVKEHESTWKPWIPAGS
ncbi:ABC transporter substrate-binding protein [Actinoplanes regularis]|uniref:Glycine betaine/proline transport system substrate-binding protein n=1 Tax=Actinoplanes regularis TaxID=52697 RepID=A0A238UT78_9ACTN|nr:ABC transporter substrate-binding protein [Actinoplanes regularis]SNR25121.1 glycine betaine/proline transport system substrate-binding protein [Actinoplanes regularis]